MYDYHCGKCGGLVGEPMKPYGYAGRFCNCVDPTKQVNKLTKINNKYMGKGITITLGEEYIKGLIAKHVLEKYGEALGIKTIEELDWNGYSLMFGGDDGLNFTKKA